MTPGTGDETLIRGDVLSGDRVFEGGAVLIDGDGVLTCVGCDCLAAAANATEIACANAAISPGLIDAETRASYGNAVAVDLGTTRYDNRNQWRFGNDGKLEIDLSNDNRDEALALAQLRQLSVGVTSVIDSSSTLETGVLRNLTGPDTAHALLDLDIDFETFPLGVTNANPESGCGGYDELPSPALVESRGAYLPRVGGGIDAASRNEVLCISSSDGVDAVFSNTTLVGAQALNAFDWELINALGAFPTWSPRSDIHTFGMTTQVTALKAVGSPFALSTYLSPFGSRDLLSELRCADDFNEVYLNGALSAFDLWLSATWFPAMVAGAQGQIGVLRPGYRGDVTIFAADTERYHAAVVSAVQQDVAAVFVGGEIRAGDATVVTALRSDCEAVSTCATPRAVCANPLTGFTLAALEAAGTGPTLFHCTEAVLEGSCVPSREGEFDGLPIANDVDGDGVLNPDDNCPSIFNPVRPLETPGQLDSDADGVGDACDPCPLDTGSTCFPRDPLDFDGDSILDWDDNCQDVFNPTQEDVDEDGIGDSCDVCNAPNPPGVACATTIYDVRGELFPNRFAVRVEGVVTAVSDASSVTFYMQVDPASAGYLGPELSGIAVALGTVTPVPTVGDRVTVTGAVTEVLGGLQIGLVDSVVVDASGVVIPPVVVTPSSVVGAGELRGAYDGLLVQVENVEVSATDSFGVTFAEGFRSEGLFYALPSPTVGQTFSTFVGIKRESFGGAAIEPRSAGDVVP